MKELFALLCGLLYIIGYPFGLTYEETSIYICIYLWPIICCISTIPILILSIINIVKHPIKGIICTIISAMYSYYYYWYTLLIIDRYNIHNKNSFMNCMIDLKVLAERLNVSYEELNLFIYIVLFIGILLFNFILYRIFKFILNKN